MRLITRADPDGLTCAVLISECEPISDIVLVHPADMQRGMVDVQGGDIVANLPHHYMASKWFDHHVSEAHSFDVPAQFDGRFGLADSAARLVYEYYTERGHDLSRYDELLVATDKLDAAKLAVSDVTHPQGWIRLLYTLDPRSGLGDLNEIFQKMIDWTRRLSWEAISEIPEVARRIETMERDELSWREALLGESRLDANVVVTDFRRVEDVPKGNRFTIYTLYPDANVSVRVFYGKQRSITVAAVGHSIFNRTCRTNLGTYLSTLGGGGHKGAGTVQFQSAEANQSIAKLLAHLKVNG